MNTRHLTLIALYSTRYSIRGGVGLVFFLISLTFGLIVAHTLLDPAEIFLHKVREMGNKEITKEDVIDELKNADLVRNAVSWVLGGSQIERIEDRDERAAAREAAEAWADHLLDERPVMLSAILLVLLWGWPFVVSLGAFNLFSGDVQSRGLRFHLIRADRSSIFLGRVLGMLLTQSIVLLILLLTIVIYMGSKMPFFGWGPLLAWGLYGAMALMILSVPYVAVCAWLSGAIDSPIASLAIINLIIGGVPLLSFLGRKTWQPMEYASYLLPWGMQHYLFHPRPVMVLGAVLVCLAYAAFFFYLGHRHFQRRDL